MHAVNPALLDAVRADLLAKARRIARDGEQSPMSKIEMAGQKKLVLITGRAYPELAEQVAEELGAELIHSTGVLPLPSHSPLPDQGPLTRRGHGKGPKLGMSVGPLGQRMLAVEHRAKTASSDDDRGQDEGSGPYG